LPSFDFLRVCEPASSLYRPTEIACDKNQSLACDRPPAALLATIAIILPFQSPCSSVNKIKTCVAQFIRPILALQVCAAVSLLAKSKSHCGRQFLHRKFNYI